MCWFWVVCFYCYDLLLLLIWLLGLVAGCCLFVGVLSFGVVRGLFVDFDELLWFIVVNSVERVDSLLVIE